MDAAGSVRFTVEMSHEPGIPTRFGPDDEDGFYATRRRILDEYLTDPAGRSDGDAFVASLMLEYKWGYGDGRIFDWGRPDLDGLLLDFFPRKVSIGPEDAAPTTEDVARFLEYLDGRGLRTGEPRSVLEARLAQLVEPLTAALAEEDGFGLAKQLGMRMADAGVDLADPDAVQAWIEAFNDGLADGSSEPLVLPEVDDPSSEVRYPAIEPPSMAELRAAAEASASLGQLMALVRYLERPHKLTQTGNLTVADGRALAPLLGIEEEFDPTYGSGHQYRTRSTADMRTLVLLVRWARVAGLVKVRHGAISATRRGLALGHEPVDDWCLVFRTFVDRSVPYERHGDYVEGPYWVGVTLDILGALPARLYRLGPIGRDELREVAVRLLDDRFGPPADPVMDPRRWIGDDLDRAVVKPLVRLGAIDASDDTLRLTPLGVWGTNRWLRALGHPAPVIGELLDATAAELLDGCATLPLEDARQEIEGWVAARPGTAARELADEARGGDRLLMAMYALGFAGPAAESEVRRLLGDPVAGSQAQLWLIQRGYDDASALPPDVLLDVMIETLTAMTTEEGSAAMLDYLTTLGPDTEQVRVIEGMRRAGHPRTSELLAAVGRDHPSKVVAKAARKVLLQREGRLH